MSFRLRLRLRLRLRFRPRLRFWLRLRLRFGLRLRLSLWLTLFQNSRKLSETVKKMLFSIGLRFVILPICLNFATHHPRTAAIALDFSRRPRYIRHWIGARAAAAFSDINSVVISRISWMM